MVRRQHPSSTAGVPCFLFLLAAAQASCVPYLRSLSVAPEVQAEWVHAYQTASTEWIACGYGTVTRTEIRIDRIQWAHSISETADRATGRCPHLPSLVAIVHPHLPRRVGGYPRECAASEQDRRALRTSGIPALVIMCEHRRYAVLTHPLAKERHASIDRKASRASSIAAVRHRY